MPLYMYICVHVPACVSEPLCLENFECNHYVLLDRLTSSTTCLYTCAYVYMCPLVCESPYALTNMYVITVLLDRLTTSLFFFSNAMIAVYYQENA